MQNIETIHLSHIDELNLDMLSHNKPLVFKKLVKNWPIVALNNDAERAQYMLSLSAGVTAPAWVADKKEHGRFFYNQEMTGMNFQQQQLAFNDVLNWLMANAGEDDIASVYLGSAPVDMLMPNYRQQNDIKQLSHAPLVSLWMGNRSTIAAHFDATDNIACVVAGKRKFSLFPPSEWDNLYVGPIEFNPAGQAISLVDFDNPDFSKHPRFKTALKNGFEALLEPGDAIYIPSMWWHSVKALSSFNLLQNYWWRQAPEPAANPTDALVHAMLAIKDLPTEQRQVWRDIFDKLIFSAEPQTHIPEHAMGFLKILDEEQAKKMRKLLKYRISIE